MKLNARWPGTWVCRLQTLCSGHLKAELCLANDVSRSGVGGGGPRKVYVNSWRLCFSDFGAGGDARVHFLLLHGYLCVGRTRHEADLTRGRKLLRELI